MAKGTRHRRRRKISISIHFDLDEFDLINVEAEAKFLSFSEIVRLRLTAYRTLEKYGLHEIPVADLTLASPQ